MCTISWFFGSQSSHIFFNRDEQKTRAVAEPPSLMSSVNHVNIIMPIDPVGGGSWLVVNEYGWTFALLNYYQGRLPKGKLRSRGEIIRGVSGLHCYSEVVSFLSALTLENYAPFSLLCFAPFDDISDLPPYQNCSTHTATMLRWSGKELTVSAQSTPLFSSAVKFDEVVQQRSGLADQYFAGIKSESQRIEKHIQLHRSHTPTASAYSICMHRDDAQTVSFSHIQITQNDIVYSYSNGAPCKTKIEVSQQLKRLTCKVKEPNGLDR